MTSTTSLRCGTTGRAVLLGSPVGPPGAEGRVYTLSGQSGQVAKLYHRDRLAGGAFLEAKLAAMVAAPPPGIGQPAGHWALAWPQELLRDVGGTVVGFTMPAVQSSLAAKWHMLANPSDRDDPPASRPWTPGFTWRYRLHAAANLADAVGSMLDTGYVPGDLSGDNVFVYRTALVTVIDVDSMQVPAPGGATFHCTVWRDEYLAPELADRRNALDRTVRQPASALFALAVLIYEMLMEGRHPFGGVWNGSGEPPSRLSLSAQGSFVDGPDPRLTSGPGALDPAVLPPELRALFDRAFVEGVIAPASRPSCPEWRRCLHRAASAVSTCQHCGHPYPDHLDTCPWCRRAAAGDASGQRIPAKAHRPRTPEAPQQRTPAKAQRRPRSTTYVPWQHTPAAAPPQQPPTTSPQQPPTTVPPPQTPAAPPQQWPAAVSRQQTPAVGRPAPPASTAVPYPPGVPRWATIPPTPAAPRSRRFAHRAVDMAMNVAGVVAAIVVLAALVLSGLQDPDTVGAWHEKIADNAPIGTCIATKQVWGNDKNAITPVPCDTPHWGEILGYPRLAPTPSPYPGVDQAWALAVFRCRLLFAERGLDSDRYAVTQVHAAREWWNEGSGRYENYTPCVVHAHDNSPLNEQLVRADQPTRPDASVRMSLFEDRISSNAPTGVCVANKESFDKSTFDVPVVPCERQHWAEIVGYRIVYSSAWPGDTAVYAAADTACRNAITARGLPPHFTYRTIWPAQIWWSRPGWDRYTTCLALPMGA